MTWRRKKIVKSVLHLHIALVVLLNMIVIKVSHRKLELHPVRIVSRAQRDTIALGEAKILVQKAGIEHNRAHNILINAQFAKVENIRTHKGNSRVSGAHEIITAAQQKVSHVQQEDTILKRV